MRNPLGLEIKWRIKLNKDLERWLSDELLKLDFSSRSIDAYVARLKRVFARYPDVDPKEISEDQIKEYIEQIVKRGKYSASTIHQTIHACHCFYNSLLSKSYDLLTIERPAREREIPDLLSEAEIVDILRHSPNKRFKLIFAFIYSAGLELIEVIDLQVRDINLKTKTFNVKSTRGNKKRTAILSEYLAREIPSYIDEFKPKKWLFPAERSDNQINQSVIQRALKRTVKEAGISKEVTPKALRVAYIKHLESQGVPLRRILLSLGLEPAGPTREFYDKIGYDDSVITWSPIDRIFTSNESGPIDVCSLRRRVLSLPDQNEKDYLLEGIKCVEFGALRAGIVFIWAAGVRNLQNRCYSHSSHTLNAIVSRRDPKARTIKKVEDFSCIREGILLEVAHDLGVIDGNQKSMLNDCLNLRNKSGHPGSYTPRTHKAAAFIEDMITLIFDKP